MIPAHRDNEAFDENRKSAVRLAYGSVFMFLGFLFMTAVVSLAVMALVAWLLYCVGQWILANTDKADDVMRLAMSVIS